MIHQAVKNLLDKYSPLTAQDYENALKEIIQQAVLAGLWRSNFFNNSAFYGGSALRIFYGLERFSEDLDFTLLKEDSGFELNKYFQTVKDELFGLGFDVSIKRKTGKTDSPIESAFLKTNTFTCVIKTGAPVDIAAIIPKSKLIKIKFEIDIKPPGQIQTENKYLLQPIPCSIRVVSPQYLFAGKVHALLYRRWKKRVKGRDWYDFVWFIQNKIPLNLNHLSERIQQSESNQQNSDLDFRKCDLLLQEAAQRLEIDKAKRDVLPFLKNKSELDVWSKDFFINTISQIKYN